MSATEVEIRALIAEWSRMPPTSELKEERAMPERNNQSPMTGVIPYLAIDGARAAIEFYKLAFAAKVFGDIAHMPGTEKVANVSLVVNGGVMMLSDHFPEQGQPPAKGGQGFTMTLVIIDGDLWWNRAVGAGCEVTVEKQFWGDRYGRLRDPFGIEWALNEPSAENQAKAKALT